MAQIPCLGRYNKHMAIETNMYGHTRARIFEEYADRLEGNRNGLVLAVFTEEPTAAAKNALEKSFAAIGFDVGACTYAQLAGLQADEVFALVEGIDPLALVACDEAAATLCSQAVHQEFPPMRPTRLFGREARALPRINAMLDTEADRQALWHALKTMA